MKNKKEHKYQSRNKKPTAALSGSFPIGTKNCSILLLILLISFIAYLPSLYNGFVGWDDFNYIENNPLIHSINLREIFSHYVKGNCHPLTILIYSVEYYFFGLHETGYHAVNLFIHLLNVLLVFAVIRQLNGNAAIALTVSLFFGVHPLHVESVAWASELKDLLYTFFFLLSYNFYLKYLNDKQSRNYFFALLLFAVSLLAKAMSASLPVILLLTDYFKGRKINAKAWIEKAPFFLLAVVFGLIAVMAQKTAGATDIVLFDLPQRIVFACYGFITYLMKIILPLKLSSYYPYPVTTGKSIPVLYYLYVLLLAGLVLSVFYSLRVTKKIVFGIGFFAITVFLVLQLLPVGGAVIADRYSYVPSIGIFFLAAEGLNLLWSKKLKWVTIIVPGSFIFFWSVKTYSRCAVWKNELSIWNDMISNYQTIPLAYNNRGNIYLGENKYQLAEEDYTKAIELNPKFTEAYNNRGNVFFNEKNYERAIDDYTKAIELAPGYDAAYYNRGNAFVIEKQYDRALTDYNKAIELNAGYTQAYQSRGNLLRDQKKIEEALSDYDKALMLAPGLAGVYFDRGLLYMNESRKDEAIDDFGKAIELNKNYVEAYVNRGNMLRDENKTNDALSDYRKALELNPDFPIVYFNRGTLFINQKKYENAILDFSKAIELNKDYSKAYFNRGLAEFYSGKKETACKDLMQASRLGFEPPSELLIQVCK